MFRRARTLMGFFRELVLRRRENPVFGRYIAPGIHFPGLVDCHIM